VVNEAMASGLPLLISSRCGSAKDLVIEGHNGFTFNPFNKKSLLNAMLKMSSQDGRKISQMSRNSKKMIEKFDIRNHAESLINCINSIQI
jgi:glycosyltransferase involved in cell wall biosynthesis